MVAARAGDYVTFHGELSEKDKRAILARSEVFVLSSPREGFSVATLEAMAQRHPDMEVRLGHQM